MNATRAAWNVLSTNTSTALDAVESGCHECELNPIECNFTGKIFLRITFES